MKTMYTVLSITPINEQQVQLIATWTFTNKLEKEETVLYNENVSRYVQSSKQKWVLSALEKWVHHKKYIIEKGKGATDLARLQAIGRAFIALEMLQNKTLETVCSQIIKGKETFRSILPHPANPSFNNSEAQLEMIFRFCEEHQHKF
jgi:hypothetical protein